LRPTGPAGGPVICPSCLFGWAGELSDSSSRRVNCASDHELHPALQHAGRARREGNNNLQTTLAVEHVVGVADKKGSEVLPSLPSA
jgi:hypothetical protein